MLNVLFTEKFISQFESLSPKVQKLAERKIDIFRSNPKHPSLKTHKLNRMLSEYFSFSVDYKIRIVFEYDKKDTVILLKIGNHDVYK